jgi:hypothetical protein
VSSSEDGDTCTKKPILKRNLLFTVFSLLGLVVATSCKKNNEVRLPIAVVHTIKAPYAYAGNDQIFVLPKDSVRLDGSGSIDPDGKIVTYYGHKFPVGGRLSLQTQLQPGMEAEVLTGYYLFSLSNEANLV